MPQTVEITLFTFDELSADASTKAREWYRDSALDDDWYQFVYQDFEQICDLVGVTLRTSTVRLMGGGTRQKPNIFFRGFYSQGDGACFEGTYRYRKGAVAQVRAYAPHDTELHNIASRLAEIQRRNFYQLSATALHRGHYCHEYSMSIDVDRASPGSQEPSEDAEDAVKEGLRDLARWLYGRLEREYEHLNSDAVVGQFITANGYL